MGTHKSILFVTLMPVIIAGCTLDMSITSLLSKALPIKLDDNLPIISDANEGKYTLSGSCTGDLKEFTIEQPEPAQTVQCKDGKWTVEIDLKDQEDGFVEIKTNLKNPVTQEPIVLEVAKDTQPPQVTQITLNAGNPYTNNPEIPFQITEQGEDFYEILFSEDPSCTDDSSWMSEKSGVIELSSADGPKDIYYQVRDKVGNITSCTSVTTTTASAVITLDQTPPTVTGLADDPLVKDSKTWNLGCEDTNGPCEFRYIVSSSADGVDFSGDFSSQTSVTRSDSGTHYLHVQARDKAGNISETKVVSAIVSSDIPGLAMVEEDRIYHTSQEVNLIPRNHGLFTWVDVYDGHTCEGTATEYNLGENQLTKTFSSDGLKTISYQFRNPTTSAVSSCAQTSITIDTVKPTVTIASTANSPTNVSPIPVTVTFSENVTGFDGSKVTLKNGSVAADSFSGSGASYSFNVVPAAQGEVQVSVSAGVAQDIAGNGNDASEVLKRTYDNLAPTITLTPPEKLAMKAADTLTWNFAISDVHQMTLATTEPIIEILSGSSEGCNISYSNNTSDILAITQEVSLNGCSGNGELNIKVKSSTVTDAAGNSSDLEKAYTVLVDNTVPVISISAPDPIEGKVNTVFTWRVSTVEGLPLSLDVDDIEIVGTNKDGCHISKLIKVNDANTDVLVTGCSTPVNDRTIFIRVLEGAVEDAVGNINLQSSNSASVKLKNTPKIINVRHSKRTYKETTSPFVSWSYDPSYGAEIKKFEIKVNSQCSSCNDRTDWIDVGTQTTWVKTDLQNLTYGSVYGNSNYWVNVKVTDVDGNWSEISSSQGNGYFFKSWSSSDQTNYASFPLGKVNSSVKDSQGRRIVAGEFDEVVISSTPLSGVARFDINGSLDTTFKIREILNGTVSFFLPQDDGKFIILGDFTHVGKTLSSGIARFNADGTFDNTFIVGPGFSKMISSSQSDFAKSLKDGRMFVFKNNLYDYYYKGVPLKRASILAADGNLLRTFEIPGELNVINDFYEYDDGKLLIAGRGSDSKPKILRLNNDFSLDETFQIGISNGAFHEHLKFTVLPNKKIVVVGAFTQFNGQSAGNIVCLKEDGVVDTTFQAGTGFNAISSSLVKITSSSDRIYIYNNHYAAVNYNGNSYSKTGLVRLKLDGTLDPILATGYSINSGELLIDGSGILILGSIKKGGENFSLIRLLEDGSWDNSYNASQGRFASRDSSGSSSGSSPKILKAANGIFAWGAFDSYENVVATKKIARFNADGSFDQDFESKLRSNIYNLSNTTIKKVILDSNERILVGAYRVYRLLEDGTEDTTFGGNCFNQGELSDFAVLPDGDLIVGNVNSSEVLRCDPTNPVGFQSYNIYDEPKPQGVNEVLVTYAPQGATDGISVAINFVDENGWEQQPRYADLFWINLGSHAKMDLFGNLSNAEEDERSEKKPYKIHALYSLGNDWSVGIISSVEDHHSQWENGEAVYYPTKSIATASLDTNYLGNNIDWSVWFEGSWGEALYISSSLYYPTPYNDRRIAIFGRDERNSNGFDKDKLIVAPGGFSISNSFTVLSGTNLYNAHIAIDSPTEIFMASDQGFYHQNQNFYQAPMCVLKPD